MEGCSYGENARPVRVRIRDVKLEERETEREKEPAFFGKFIVYAHGNYRMSAQVVWGIQ